MSLRENLLVVEGEFVNFELRFVKFEPKSKIGKTTKL